MNNINDNVEERCYLQYLLSKYISNPFSGSQVQEFKTQYNSFDQFYKVSPVVITVAKH